MPARTVSVLDALATSLPNIFEQAQLSTANHKKNCIALHKLHTECAQSKDGVQRGEKAFADLFLEMMNRTLAVKKGTAVAERVVKFVASYVKTLRDKGLEDKSEQKKDGDTFAFRFVTRLLKHVLKGFLAKDKSVRYRAVQFVAEMVSYLGEIDEDLYTDLRSSLFERVRDKESPIRVQAIIAVYKLTGSEDPADYQNGEQSLMDTVLDVLTYDLAADVRRQALLNVPPIDATLDSILARTRDVDSTVRKLVYSHTLERLEHPGQLTISQRELVVRNGLGDREPTVQAAAGKLIGTWVDQIGGDLVEFLCAFDLIDTKVPEDALLSVFTTRPDIWDALKFNDDFWVELTPEKAFLARVFVEHCINTKDDARLESSIPVVTALAFNIQSSYNELVRKTQAEADALIMEEEDDEAREKREDETADKEFVIGEMLKLAVNLDYGDEIGRRKMFGLVRDMISQQSLPEALVARCLDILRKLSPSERDLIRIVVEVVHELRDPTDLDDDPKISTADDEISYGGDTPVSARTTTPAPNLPKPAIELTPEEKARVDAIDLRCLDLCIGMLERVNGTFEENSTLEGILGELIIPSVKRKELALREKGLISLGLCCLIARRMALNSFQLFLGQIQAAPEILKIRVLQIVFDILMVHDSDLLGKQGGPGERVVEFLLHLLQTEDSDKVQAVLCVGISKLMLSGMISDEQVLKTLVLAFVSPDTAANQELRQCLSYFLPVYCYSSPVNQRRMQKIFISVFQRVSQLHKDQDDQDIVTPAQVSMLLADWTDPQKAIELQGQAGDDNIHLDLASDILKALFTNELSKDDKKALCQLLGKLYLPFDADDDKIRTLKLLVNNLQLRRPLRDVTAKNALARFDKAFTKLYEKQLESFNEEEFRQLEELKELFEFLDDIIPEDDDEESDASPPPQRRAGKRRSQSVTTNSTADSIDESENATPAPRLTRKGKSKRRRLSKSDDEDDEDDRTAHGGSPPSEMPTRTMPKRTAAPRQSIVDIDSDSESDEDVLSTPVPKRSTPGSNSMVKKMQEARLDAEIDDLLEGEEAQDSIMDSDSEDEVDDLL